MLSGHVVGNRFFWPCSCGKFSRSVSSSVELFQWAESLLSLSLGAFGSVRSLAALPFQPDPTCHSGRALAIMQGRPKKE